MSEELIQIHQLGQSPIEIPRDRIIWTDRSRMEVACHRKRYIQYHYDGTGYVTTARNDDFALGAAVHEGIDLLLQGGSIETAREVAVQSYEEAPDWGDHLLPEQKQILFNDGVHLVQALIYSFYVNYLPQILEEYDVVAVEEEINWLMATMDIYPKGHHYLVCMSRPDAVLRHKETGKLWHVSHKTCKSFTDLQISKLDVDIQRFTEGLAIEAKYGEAIEGTLYNYFVKGTKWKDSWTNLDRYTSGLIRPWIYRGPGGPLTPEQISYGYEYQEVDTETGKISNRRLGKGWERADIYREMDYSLFLEWLREKWIKVEGRDYLQEAVAGMVPVFWTPRHAERWLRGASIFENAWGLRMMVNLSSREDLHDQSTDVTLPLDSAQCFSYNSRCSYFDICWRERTPDDLLGEGSLAVREPNHLIEFYESL